MKKGFTILELLVASLLLGMLMTVLTMIFNQSSISWRIGVASVADLDDTSDGISTVRYEADNLYTWGTESYALLSVFADWDGDKREFRNRAIDAPGVASVTAREQITKLKGKVTGQNDPGDWTSVPLDSEKSHSGVNTYTVNVMSAGPNKQFNDYDDIWSFPNEFN